MSGRFRSAADADVAVVGGGVVGLALAAILGRAALRVAIVETRAPAVFDVAEDYDLRVFAITRASERILGAAGAWESVRCGRCGCFRHMEVWDEASPGRIRFDAAAIAEPALGYVIEQRLLRAALEAALAASARVTWYRPAALNTWSVGEQGISLQLSNGQRFSARLVVGADGAESCVRTLAGIGYERHEYDQHAIVCNVATELAHGDTARQRFLRDGPLAFLPLAGPQACSIVWSTSPANATALLGRGEDAFREELGGAFDHALGRITAVGPRAAFPLARARAEHYVQPRIALIGDAAHSIHPLAGQGANLGLLDAATLAEVIIEAIEEDRDPGALRVLRRYERWRKGENLAMQSAMDGFKYLFGSPSRPVQWLRGVGLNFTDRARPIKNLIMRRAMGLEGDLPRFARPIP